MSKKRHHALKFIDLTPEQMKEFLKGVSEKRLDEGDWEVIEGMAPIIHFVSQAGGCVWIFGGERFTG